ncbi:putative copper resistance protein D [Microterricola gilva]|uniref:Putative copper resistance protein D n=1 Tax=Microterricola gilva TaxID=393267 RepID=A0A4Q8AS62_9MICO|nr:cytochrome c oxidase assembly protein [Microterricola gilva]RZU67023.1 putative copper resistance protein D [Microterricola gilva]
MLRLTRVLGPAALLLFAIAALVAGLTFGGGAAPQLLQDPGAVVRWGLPVSKLFVNLGAAAMIGALILSCFALSPKQPEFNAALDVAAAGAAVFTVAAAFTGFFTYLSVTGATLSLDAQFGASLSQFLTQIELGQAWLITTLVGAAVTVLCFAVRNHTLLVFVTVLAVAALIPMAQQGHAAGTAGHNAAVTSLGLHIAAAAAWLGGLITVVLLRDKLDRRLTTVLARYSTVALIAFLVLTISGVATSILQLGSFENLLSDYGVILLAKVAALIVLGFFGVIQRTFFIERMQRAGAAASATAANGVRWFWGFVVAELAFMGIASGLAVALARTPKPVTPGAELTTTRTPAELLSGEMLPPELTFSRYFTEWNIDLIWLLACAFGIFFYLAGVWRLTKRGDSWPIYRTVLWIAGMIALFYVSSGGVAVYGKFLFSTHMLAHMALTMAIPVLLVPGAPVTLAMRAIRPRKDGSRGPREWILLAVHSRFASIIANPIVAAVLFAGSLWVFYFSPLFSWATTDHIGHQWMTVHFLITGYLFVQSLIGIDPVPYRLPYPFRLLLLLGTMAFHAFFGLAIMTGTGLLLADWYGATGRSWGLDALADQQMGGGIAWSVGEIPTLALAITVAIQWSRSDAKETKRSDRNADRTHEAELNAYNENLARIAERDNAGR